MKWMKICSYWKYGGLLSEMACMMFPSTHFVKTSFIPVSIWKKNKNNIMSWKKNHYQGYSWAIILHSPSQRNHKPQNHRTAQIGRNLRRSSDPTLCWKREPGSAWTFCLLSSPCDSLGDRTSVIFLATLQLLKYAHLGFFSQNGPIWLIMHCCTE